MPETIGYKCVKCETAKTDYRRCDKCGEFPVRHTFNTPSRLDMFQMNLEGVRREEGEEAEQRMKRGYKRSR